MGLDRIVCLANSYKHENRCVAGISLVTKKWVRLVSFDNPGCLTEEQTCYPDGTEAGILDVFEAELGDECGSNSHPEDVLVLEKAWHLVRQFELPTDARFLAGFCNKGPALLKGYGDRLYGRRIEGNPVEHSLELIHPEDLWWWIREDKGKRKNRGLFKVGNTIRARYDLAVTDPLWLKRMHSLPPGIYPHAKFFDGKTPNTFLTISLSEPFEGFHYKLVAGVVLIPS
jgi:hypothetical protein